MTAIDDTIRRFGDDPAAAQSTPTVTATLANGHARLSAGPFNWDADLPPALGGANQAPSPTAYLLGALAGCAVAFIADTLAPQFRVQVDSLRATARCTTDARGLLGMDGAVPQLRHIEIDIDLESPSDAARVDAVRAAWIERCPVLLALSEPNQVNVTFDRSAPGC